MEAPAGTPRDLALELLSAAHRQGASDIHVQAEAVGCHVLFRVDGILRVECEHDHETHERLVARYKVLAGLLVYRRDIPQEGSFSVDTEHDRLAARVSVLPAIAGEKVVVRLFPRVPGLEHLDGLGLPDVVVNRLRAWTRHRRGVVLLTGPAGSGKTTTAYALVRDIVERCGRLLNVCTIEDPVEVRLPGTTQLEIDEENGLGFARGLRSLLRQDPDVLMVGEIRDRETAAIAIQAGLTGHLVISSIHSGDTAETFIRLLNMGIEPYLIASAVYGVVAQRLVRTLTANGDYRGRTALGEAIEVNDGVREAILARPTTAELRRQVASSVLITLREDGESKITSGLTTREETARVLAEDLVQET